MARPKWGAIGGTIAALALLLFAVPSFLRHNTGAKADQIPVAFEQLKACADSASNGNAGVRGETLSHAVNGGVHIVSDDSLHKLLPGQPVAALTQTAIDSTRHDTTITIYTAPPLDLNILKHEFANALSARHRRALIGSDTGKFLTSAFYRRCVTYCPRCAAGAY
jgi:hypothetical protein